MRKMKIPLFDRLFKGFIERRKQLENALRFWMQLFPAGPMPAKRGTREIIRSYKNLPWLLACCSKISMSISAVPWELFAVRKNGKAIKVKALGRDPKERMRYLRKSSEGSIETLQEHPLLDLLENGNEFMSGRFLMQLTQIWLDIVGEAFWVKERNVAGVVTGLYPVPPTLVSEVASPGNPFFRMGVSQHIVPAEDVVWFRYPNPENPFGRGVGFGLALSDEIDADEFAAQHIKSWFYNRARPDLLIMPSEGHLSKEDTERLEYKWLEKTKGFLRAYKPFFMSRRVEIKELSQSFADMQLVDLRKSQRDTIIQVFGIPPELLGIIENSNRATIESADYLFSQWVLLPRLEILREVLQNQLVPDFDERIIVDYVSPVAEDKEYVLSVAKAAPWSLTVNEWRDMMGLSPLPEGDVFMVPINLFPQSASSEKSFAGTSRKSLTRTITPLLTEEQQIKRWEAKVPVWERWERKWVRRLKKYFQEQQNEVSRRIRQQVKAVEDLLFDAEEFNKKLEELAQPLYVDILKEGYKEAGELLGLEYSFDVNNPRVQKWIGARLKFIKDINDTTRDALKETLREGMNAGEGVSQLLDRVSEVFKRAKGWRAENIARTETVAAYVEGNIDLYHEAGVKKVAFWAAIDERTCEECMGKHGEVYNVENSHNIVPVHPSCRCDFIPVV